MRNRRCAVMAGVLWIIGVGVFGLGGVASELVVVRMEGTVLEVSGIPDPAVSEYKECLFTLKVSPRRDGEELGAVLLVLQAFVDRELTGNARLAVGDRVGVVAVPFADMPEAYRSQRMADTIEDLDLAMWAGLEVEVLRDFGGMEGGADAGGFPAAGGSGVLAPAAVSTAARAEREAWMQEELGRIRALADAHGGWEVWYQACGRYREQLAAQPAAVPGQFLVKGRGMLIDPASALSYQFPDDDAHYQTLLAGMENLARQFRMAGTDLIVAPIPGRDEVYAAAFIEDPPPDGILQPYRLKFFHDLLVRGVEGVDLMPEFRDALTRGGILYHDNTVDGHLSGEGARVAGEWIAQRLRRYEFARAPVSYIESPLTYVYAGEMLVNRPEQTYQAWRVREPNWSSVARDAKDSEILVIGDSMVTAPPRVHGASLGLHIMRAVGIPCTFYKHAGSAPKMARFLTREGSPEFFSNRKTCVFVFAFDYVKRPEEAWAVAPFVERWMEEGE